MKILISAYSCRPNEGREQGCGWNWPLELAKLGHEVWVITREEYRLPIEKVLKLKPNPYLHFVYIDESKFIGRCLKNRIRFVVQYLLWQRKIYDVALHLDKEQQFDIVHHLNTGSLKSGSRLWRLNKPFVIGPVGGGQIAPAPFKKYFLKWWWGEMFRSFFIRRLLPYSSFAIQSVRQSNLVLATNQATVNLARRLGARNVKLHSDLGLPKGYIPQRVRRIPATKELRVLWVGRMYPLKALLLALESLAQVKSSTPFKLTLIGGGATERYMPEWVKKLGLQKRVKHLGFLSWDKVREQYKNHDIFLFTSLRDSCGAQLLEAMAFALPIITLNHHGARDIVPDNAAIKVSVSNPNKTVSELARAIEYMYENPDKRLAMGKAGYHYAKTQTWEKKVKYASDHYYKNLVARRQRNNGV